MAKSSTNISIDSDIKAKAQNLFADLGLDLSTAINIFLRQAIRDNGFPFEITRNANITTVEAIEKAERGEDIHGPYSSVAELMEALNA